MRSFRFHLSGLYFFFLSRFVAGWRGPGNPVTETWEGRSQRDEELNALTGADPDSRIFFTIFGAMIDSRGGGKFEVFNVFTMRSETSGIMQPRVSLRLTIFIEEFSE